MFAANPFLLSYWAWMAPFVDAFGFSTGSQRGLLRNAQVAELITLDAAKRGLKQVEALLV